MDTFTAVHVAVSGIAILTGFVVLASLLSGTQPEGWIALFLITSIATSATGFGFAFTKLLPSHTAGALSLVLLAAAVYARYADRLADTWRPVFIASAIAALYLNVFVLIAQAFAKIPALQALAPAQSEPPFAIAQALVLAAFVYAGFLAVRRDYAVRNA